MKSASSELDALSGGVAGNCLLPPENEYAVPNIVARVAMASCRRGNVNRNVPMGGSAGTIGAGHHGDAVSTQAPGEPRAWAFGARLT